MAWKEVGAFQPVSPMMIGMAWTRDPARPEPWTRLAEPVLTRDQPDCRAWEKLTQYKSNIIHDADRSLGHPFVMFYNAKTQSGYEVIGSDIAMEMMNVAASQLVGIPRLHGYVRADAERLPLADGAIDCVMSIRFLLHIDPVTRISIIREMARVSTRWLILDYRHKHSYRYMTLRLRRALGGPSARKRPQVSRAEMTSELAAAGVRVAKIFPIAPFFSDKWVVLCEKTVPA